MATSIPLSITIWGKRNKRGANSHVHVELQTANCRTGHRGKTRSRETLTEGDNHQTIVSYRSHLEQVEHRPRGSL